MDVRDYCSGIQYELTGWKAKIYDVVRKLDKMPTGDKQKVIPQVNDLHIILEDLTERIEYLKRECPTDWASEKAEVEKKIDQLKSKWEKIWGDIYLGAP